MTIRTKGIIEARANVRALARKKPKAFAAGLLRMGLDLQAESQALCPVDTGALRASARTFFNDDQVSGGDGGALAAVQTAIGRLVSFLSRGSFDPFGRNHPFNRINVTVEYPVEYAVYVHEDPNAYHPVGQYKFLEEPARTGRSRRTAQLIKDVSSA